jgi:penicillin-binding protein 1A
MRLIIRFLFKFFLILFLVCGSIGVLTGFYFYFKLTRDLPKLEKLSDYNPRAVSSIYSDDGTLMAEVFDQYRYPVKLDEIPLRVRQAFLAAEDGNFYKHPGIDFISVVRAAVVNFRSHASKQGASTITQQVVKSMLLTKEKTFERKAKEALLSYRLEKALSKDDIFSIYLNEIYLGNHSYGIKAAAKMHFHKQMSELSLAEMAFLGGLPQSPTKLMNPRYFESALKRERYVLGQMLRNGFISEKEYQEALKEKIVIQPVDLDKTYNSHFYVTHAITVSEEVLREIDRKFSLKRPGGFKVVTAANTAANKLAEASLKRGLEELDKRRGWRGPLDPKKPHRFNEGEKVPLLQPRNLEPLEIYRASVTGQKKGIVQVRLGDFEGDLDLSDAAWAKRFLTKDEDVVGIEPLKLLTPGVLVDVSIRSDQPINDIKERISFKLNQWPEVEGAFAVASPLTGEVKAIVGGYDYRESVFNRATQGELQPGSSFKPFIYVAAIDQLHLTPSSLVPDSPISLVAGGGKIWSPQNFDHKYLGPITLRTALQRSRNVVSVYLLNKIGVDRGIQSAKNLGISTEIPHNMSIALGTPEVKLIDMVRAYGAFAAGGWLADTVVVKEIYDRNNKKIYSKDPNQKKVLSDESAFIMANMMKGVVERGTATVVKALNKPCAGKTGTTNNHMDAWFIGYTPEWVGGVWTGFDQKKSLGKQETGGKAAAPIFLSFMKEFLKDEPPLDFEIPDTVVPVAVDLNSGRPVNPSAPGAFIEYFKSGTEPQWSGSSGEDQAE